jgi:hypothetical protein
MLLVNAHPRTVSRFVYDPATRLLRAYHLDGHVTLCSGVPEAMFHVLEKTPLPEEFFASYIVSQFESEVAATQVRSLASH